MASLQRIFAIARKEFIHILRDWRMIVAVLFMPLLQLMLFAYAIGFDVRNVPTLVYDSDHTQLSRSYIQATKNTGFFDIQGYLNSYTAVDAAFDAGRARAIIVIPQGFETDVQAGRKGELTVLVDGSEPNSAQLGRSYALALNQTFGREVLVKQAEFRGMSVPTGSFQPQVRIWYNPGRSSADFLVPGLMVVVVMIVTIQQTAVTLVKERDQGTLEQLLVSPLSDLELILGKVAPWAVLGFIEMFLITVVSLTVFHVPLRGNVTVLAVSTFVFVLSALGIGLVISAVAPSPESANLTAILVSFLPGFMLSGMAFPLNSIPIVLQWASYLFPGRYMVQISRGVFLRGAGWAVLTPQVVQLVIYAIAVLGLAAFLNRRQTPR